MKGMPFPDEIAFRLPSAGASARRQVDVGKRAAAVGYDAILTSETWGYDAFTRLGYLAATTDVTLGTAIVPVHSRAPSLIAQTAGTLSRLSDTETVLGIGLSSPAVIEKWYGMEFEPALRHERETIEIARRVLSGKPLDYDGKLFNLDFGPIRFEPPDNVSIYVAAQGETNRRLVGEFADGWMPTYIPLSSLAAARSPIKEGAHARGRKPREVATVPFLTTCVLDDGERARECCRETIAFYIGGMGKYHYNALANHGYRETADRIRNAWTNGDHEGARAAVTDDLLDEVALAGTPNQAREHLRTLPDLVDMLVTVPSTQATPKEVEATAINVGEIIAME